MCTYQGSQFLREQLESILVQERRPDELVVSDDGSTDHTKQIIETFRAMAPFEVRFIGHKKRLGTTKNFEACISACTGDLIALSDQDDAWYPERLAHQAAILESDSSIGAVFSDADLMNEKSQLLGIRLWSRIRFSVRQNNEDYTCIETLVRELLRHDVITGATLMIRAGLRSNIFPIPESWVHDGWIAWIVALTSRVAAVSDPLIRYRVHPNQQIGLGPLSLAGQIRHARERGRQQYSAAAARLRDLKNRVSQFPESSARVDLNEIEHKIRHAEFQANLARNYLLRACQIAISYDQYQKYSLGLHTMCKDLLL